MCPNARNDLDWDDNHSYVYQNFMEISADEIYMYIRLNHPLRYTQPKLNHAKKFHRNLTRIKKICGGLVEV